MTENYFFLVLKSEIQGESSFHGTVWDWLKLGFNGSPWLTENPHVHEGCVDECGWVTLSPHDGSGPQSALRLPQTESVGIKFKLQS